MPLTNLAKRAISIFTRKEPYYEKENVVYPSHFPQYRAQRVVSIERNLVMSIYNRMALDVASVPIRHVRVDDNDFYIGQCKSSLNDCFRYQANIDQTPRQFIHDVVISMFDEGVVALVPTDTYQNPFEGTFDVCSLRVGKIVKWYPDSIKVNVYNEHTGKKEDLTLPKDIVAIVENPFYYVMNESNSVMKRLMAKLNMVDTMDANLVNNKLNILFQLPYALRSDLRKKEAIKRHAALEEQLMSSKTGSGYIDATEKVIQLNRPIESSLMPQIEYLTKMAYSQLCITQEIMNGTAPEEVMVNYYNNTIEPILSAIVDAMKVSFISITARKQGQSIKFFRDPFKLTSVRNIADIADRFTRNEILSSNEVRSVLGYVPSDDPRADELVNKNIRQAGQGDISTDEYYPEENYQE